MPLALPSGSCIAGAAVDRQGLTERGGRRLTGWAAHPPRLPIRDTLQYTPICFPCFFIFPLAVDIHQQGIQATWPKPKGTGPLTPSPCHRSGRP